MIRRSTIKSKQEPSKENINIISKIKRTVLIVDDEIINQEILKEILGTEYDILVADNGLDALHKVQTNCATNFLDFAGHQHAYHGWTQVS
ncbi:MAG: hypothetical protein K6F14_08690 [Clostridiales bacterium]|nr:hypothetical protein [Clostridiales bacterium]